MSLLLTADRHWYRLNFTLINFNYFIATVELAEIPKTVCMIVVRNTCKTYAEKGILDMYNFNSVLSTRLTSRHNELVLGLIGVESYIYLAGQINHKFIGKKIIL